MTALPPIAPSAISGLAPLLEALPAATSTGQTGSTSFASVLAEGLKSLEAKVGRADELAKQFALDDSIPVHQVTVALEEARLAVELAMQVRARLLESYRDLMNMQL